MKPVFKSDSYIFDELKLRNSNDLELKISIDLIDTSNKGYGIAQVNKAISTLTDISKTSEAKE